MPQFLPIRLTHCSNSLAWSSWQLSYTHTYRRVQRSSHTLTNIPSLSNTRTHNAHDISYLKVCSFSSCIKRRLILSHNHLPPVIIFLPLFLFSLFFAFPNPSRLSAPLISILGLLSCLLSCQISSHRFSTMYALLSPWCRYFGIVGKTSPQA